ncbi:MAG: hypothetical protein EOO05_21625, partial [Chitinophagaceae bacterium]
MKTTSNPTRNIPLAVLLALFALLSLSGCKKFLDEKPSKNLKIVSTLADAQALLDYYPELNQRDLGAGEVSADDYYLSQDNYNQMEENFQRMYTWEKDRLFAAEFNDWSNLYGAIYRANTALEVLSNNSRTAGNLQSWDNIKGQALFFRGWFYLQGLQIWSPAYQESSADTDLAIPLRNNTNFNEASSRPSLKTAYQLLEKELKEAVDLLPVSQPGLTRPSKAAATALLARLYLFKG